MSAAGVANNLLEAVFQGAERMLEEEKARLVERAS